MYTFSCSYPCWVGVPGAVVFALAPPELGPDFEKDVRRLPGLLPSPLGPCGVLLGPRPSPAKCGGTSIEPLRLPGRLVLGLLNATEPRREEAEAESTESRLWLSRPRVAPRDSWDRQDSQYRDWKFSTWTACVL